MNIQALNKLLKGTYPTGTAWVSQSTDSRGRNKTTRFVNIAFFDGGKTYQYSQSIGAVAERLGLGIPPP